MKKKNFFSYEKKNNCKIIIDGTGAFGKFWLFQPLFRYTESDSRKSVQKSPKSNPIVSKTSMSPFYSLMRLSTKFEENQRGEAC